MTPPPVTDAIVLKDVHKQYPRIRGYRDVALFWKRQTIDALNGVDLEIASGEAFGLLGPNGAGKSTLLKILAGLVLPTSGKVFFGGVDVTDHPERMRETLVLVTAEERTLYWRLTGRQNLRFFAALYEIPGSDINRRVQEVLDIVELGDSADDPVMKYSTGMKHRVALARGLLADPDILLLDEPTRSLDPRAARHIWEFIKNVLIGELNRTVLIATHNMEEATFLCNRVAILDRGLIRACDSVESLRGRIGSTRTCQIDVDVIPDDVASWMRQAKGLHDVKYASPNGHEQYSLVMSVDDPDQHLPEVVERLVHGGSKISRVSQHDRSLTDVIMELTGARS